MNIINFPLCITNSRTYSLTPGLYPATIRSRATPRLSDNYPMPGLSRTVRPLPEAGLLPDCPNDPRSRGCSRTIRLLSEVRLSLTLETAQGLSRRQERVYFVFTILTYEKTSSLRTHTPDANTYDTQWTRFMVISPLTNVGLFPIKSEHKLTLPAPTRAAVASMERVTKDDARDPSKWHVIFPGSNTTLYKLLRYTYYVLRSVIRYTTPPPPQHYCATKKGAPGHYSRGTRAPGLFILTEQPHTKRSPEETLKENIRGTHHPSIT